ncbi:AraC family transcriptional regulator [Ruminococcus sp.]|uniref:AraC family transcriptional regulator n=1 Tax=Ruminococcus sp. TaxID=41978 RepID=UPI0025FA6F1D|nr:AraC family transcriptional regulator [Ruminococcus sp.]MBQ6033953.1 AraC family transcriptional regulator [Ruminococcus sp.]MBQ6251329.1 AraC family transcriptional regulator [Ruminococcus sp.]MBR0512189.1 AraC family transcriptional regulator [Ruminococcus sp.]MBR6995962.1 AraC family transcriptional regulator [Ruminococcus sp.]
MDIHGSSGFRNKLSRRLICTPSPAAKNTFFYIQETGCLKTEDAAATQRHNLDSFLIAAVISGRGEVTIGNETYPLGKGDCFFLDCRISHFYKSSANDPWELMWVHFNGSTSQQYYDYFISQSKNVFRPPFFDKVVSAISDIIDINDKKLPDAEITTSKLIVDLLTLSLTVNNTAQQYDSALKQKLAAVHNYIDDHFNEDLSLEKLSSEFYISKYYLTREYKRIYGKTIFQHIITARINYGKKLLRFSDKSVEEISHLCGFNDQSYFARQFKKTENLTCFSYRKMWRD